MRAMRSASPTLRIAVPSTKPPSTSQKASDWKPENSTSGGAERNTATAAKNSSAVRYSGSALVAHSRMAMAQNQPGWMLGMASVMERDRQAWWDKPSVAPDQ